MTQKNEGQAVTLYPETAPAITPMQMLQIAVEQGADLDKLEKLMSLQERWEANEARKAFQRAKQAFKADPPAILKTKKVGFGKTEYSHAKLDEIVAATCSALADHGLEASWDFRQNNGDVTVTCTLTHEAGHSSSVSLGGPPDNSGSKNPVQAVASTVSYLERYTLLGVLGLAAADMDSDGRKIDQEMITEDQIKELREKLNDIARDHDDLVKLESRLCTFLKVAALEMIPASEVKRAHETLDNTQQKRAAK